MSTHRADIRAQGLEQRAALREGAREHAQFQAQPSEVPFPAGDYPVTLAAVVLRLEALEAKAREIGPNTPIGPGLMPQPYRAVTDDETALMIEAAKKALERETIRAASADGTRGERT